MPARAFIAEFIATFALVFFGPVAVTLSVLVLEGGVLTTSALLIIALAHGLAITLMVYAIGHISGAHINPAVTIPMMALRKISLLEGAGYLVSQLTGAVVAATAHGIILPQAVGAPIYLGLNQPGYNLGFSEISAFAMEIIMTFFLVFVIFGTAVHTKAPVGWAGFAIGFTVLLDHLVGVPISGASMNPARTFGPALITGNWNAHWVYWAGPIIGGLLAAFLYFYVFIKNQDK